MTPLLISDATLGTAGILLLTIVAVESGGLYLLRLVRGRTAATGFQLAFARAGHAHAGVLVILSLVALLYADASGATGILGSVARSAIPLAAILMPTGFFLSSAGRGRTQPNGLIVLIYAGGLALAAGAVALGWSLIVS